MLWCLLRRFRGLVVVAVVASVVYGGTNVWLLSLMNQAINGVSGERRIVLLTFAGAVVLMAISQLAMHMLFEFLSHRALAELRSAISNKAIAVELLHLEHVGGDKVQAALAEHSVRVANFFAELPAIITNAVVVLGCMSYMTYLSTKVMLLTMSVIGLGAVGYYAAQRRAEGHFKAASDVHGELHGHFRVLVEGAKELRLNRARRESFSKQLLQKAIAEIRKRRTSGMAIFHVAAAWGRLLIFGLIGLVLFLTADGAGRAELMTGFALVLIFMIEPLQRLLESLPAASIAKHSSARIDEVSDRLLGGINADERAPTTAHGFGCIRLEQVRHRYSRDDSDETFTVGPVDIEFVPGEVTYIVGGNGSGKTTLAKLIVGLYPPEEGKVVVDGREVTDAERDDYRQLFSAVFADSHLFVHLLEVGRQDLDERANGLLHRLQLDSKVRVVNGAFSTRALSQGQRKRLALLVATMEDRPFVVFDEWAADQDPVFKEVFYREIIPGLKAAGKAIVVISHDDRYFDLADRRIHMENGVFSVSGRTRMAA